MAHIDVSGLAAICSKDGIPDPSGSLGGSATALARELLLSILESTNKPNPLHAKCVQGQGFD